MKGLLLAEEYFNAVGLPMIETRFPQYRERIAAGLVGKGSECLGYDDALSRDHDWGPGFCIWLDGGDFNLFGAHLQRQYESLPKSYKGFNRHASPWGQNRVGVMEIGRFYRSFIGLPGAPERTMEWLVVPEYNFAACISGKVFVDPIGKFSAVRKKIKAYYPEDVRLKKMAARCMSAAQSGQYNYRRCLNRNDAYGANCSLIRFCEDVLSLVFLLNRRFMPYYKWHCRAAVGLPILGPEISQTVSALCQSSDPEMNCRRIDSICENIANELRRRGISRKDGSALLDHGPDIQLRIEDPDMKQLDVWYGGG